MKKALSILVVAAMLLSLALPVFAEGIDYTTGTPWPDIDLDGVVTADMEADLKDNFALAVNKDKILALEIPTGYSGGGTVRDVAIKVGEDLKEMFLGDAPEGHDELLAYNYFQLLMDWDGRNAQGIAPLKAQVDQVEAIDSIEALTAYFELPSEDRLADIWESGAMGDLTDSSRRVIAVINVDLLLGDSAEYARLTPYGEMTKQAYTELARKLLDRLGYSEDEAQQKIENSLAFETMLAPSIYTTEEQGSADYYGKILNYLSPDELRELEGNLPILEGLQGDGYPEAEAYLVMNPGFIETLNGLYTEENLNLIKDFLIVRGSISVASTLDRQCYDWDRECGNALTGASGSLDDATVFSAQTSKVLRWPTAKLYASVYLKQEDKVRIAEMVEEMKAAYHGIIEEADFLSDETRANAIAKLDAIKCHSLYPDDWDQYSCEDLEITGVEAGGTLWEALRNQARFATNQLIKKLSEPVDKDEWTYPPQTVNCFYSSTANSVFILGAFAQGGIYNSDMSDEEMLAKLGTVIGHEISHAFDSKGAQFDKDGNLANWWTEEDKAAFQAKNQKLQDYFSAMHPWEGQDFHAAIMTGETCADMAGVKVALRIAAEKENFDYDAFFRAYADIWLTKETLQAAYTRINDEHAMGYLRVNTTLQQYDEFLDFYGITEGDGMYLAPEDRVNVW
ncbi:MAG: M13 family metallopeptidase [Clostridia bacterium]|nr:M13 family metallopeptidase [Clostridia bacterium]